MWSHRLMTPSSYHSSFKLYSVVQWETARWRKTAEKQKAFTDCAVHITLA